MRNICDQRKLNIGIPNILTVIKLYIYDVLTWCNELSVLDNVVVNNKYQEHNDGQPKEDDQI